MNHREKVLTSDRPPRHRINLEAIPQGLRETPRFIIWDWNRDGGRLTKVPRKWDGKTTGSAKDPANWKPFEATAVAVSHGLGVGIWLNGDGIVGIDLDDCRDPANGTFSDDALRVLEQLNSYSEVSPSETGVKIFFKADIPKNHEKKLKLPNGGNIEIYSKGRYFTLTGKRIDWCSPEVEDRTLEARKLLLDLGGMKAEREAPQSRPFDYIVCQQSDDAELVAKALEAVDCYDEYDDWLKVGQAIHAFDSSPSGLLMWDQWSAKSSRYSKGACGRKWGSFTSDGGRTVATLFALADETGKRWRPEIVSFNYSDVTFKDFEDNVPRANIGLCDHVEGQIESNTKGQRTSVAIIEPPNDPHRLARIFIRQNYTLGNGLRKLTFWQGAYWVWDSKRWKEIKKSELIAELTASIKAEFDRINLQQQKNWEPKPGDEEPPKVIPVTKNLLANVENAVASIVMVSSDVSMPDWLCGDPPFPARETLSTVDRLLHLPSLVSGTSSHIRPTPMLFSPNCLSYTFNPTATCPAWSSFLESLWPSDQDSIDSLQEWFGYLLLPDTRQHKLLMLIGPPRSGKGTIVRILQLLLGEGNVASPTLSSLTGPFGLWPLLNRFVALIPDARLSGRDDSVAVVERILSITGEDPQDINRKNLPTLTGVRMPVRFVLMSNELPALKDASGAFMTRVTLLRMTESFIGREDRTLSDRLAQELPGILNWSIEGWKRLNSRGHFIQPSSATELLEDLENLSSPIKQFVADSCDLGPTEEATVAELFFAWKKWCEINHRDHMGTNQTFGRDLRAAIPHLKQVQRRIGNSRERGYIGISVKIIVNDF